MTTHEFFVSGTPKGQPRPRAFAFRGKARVFDPGTAEGWKAAVAVAAKDAGVPRFDGGVSLRLTFMFRRPKSHFGKSGLKPSAPLHHTHKPDVDNLAKAVMDALTSLGVWSDDAQVCDLTVHRIWSVGLTEGCGISIRDFAV